MELILALAGLTILVGAAGRVVGAMGGSSDLLAGLFRSSHELGWPIGVQEEDRPPTFASDLPGHEPGSPPEPPAEPPPTPAPPARSAVRGRLAAGSACGPARRSS
jgi:hypothetical protein